MTHMTWGVIIASGKDQKLGPDVGMAFLNVKDRPLITYAILAYESCVEVDGIVVVASKDRLESVQGVAQMYGCSKLRKIVAGTNIRRTSVMSGLKALEDDVSIVSIHDVSRPCASVELIAETIKAAKRYGSGVAAARITDPVKEAGKGQKVKKSLDGSKLWAAQSPQTFKRDLLTKALAGAERMGLDFDDEAEAVEALSKEVHLVPSQGNNMRISAPADLALAAVLLK